MGCVPEIAEEGITNNRLNSKIDMLKDIIRNSKDNKEKLDAKRKLDMIKKCQTISKKIINGPVNHEYYDKESGLIYYKSDNGTIQCYPKHNEHATSNIKPDHLGRYTSWEDLAINLLAKLNRVNDENEMEHSKIRKESKISIKHSTFA